MFFGICIYETLHPDGRLDSTIIRPEQGRSLVADRRSEVGPRLHGDVDIGPLRFYTNECKLSVQTARSIMRPPLFQRDGETISLRIEHSHLPLPECHAGYYFLLLPPDYAGHVHCFHAHPSIHWLSDTRQLLVSVTATPEHPHILIEARLRHGAQPDTDAKTTTTEELYRHSLPGIYFTPVDNLLKAMRHDLEHTPASAFLCHSSADKEAARRLAIELATRGVRPWIDEAEIRTGDSLIEKLEHGINSTTCLIPILSATSVASAWCREELRMALNQQITKRVKRVLPALIQDCEIPGFLIDKVYADLRGWQTYDSAVDRLSDDIRHAANVA